MGLHLICARKLQFLLKLVGKCCAKEWNRDMECKYCKFAYSWQKWAYSIWSIRRSIELYIPTLNLIDVCHPNPQASYEDSYRAFESIERDDESNGNGRMELLAKLVPLLHVHLHYYCYFGHAHHKIPNIASLEHIPTFLLFLALQSIPLRVFSIHVIFI